MEAELPHAFGANLQGCVVACATAEDAVALRRADAVLRDREVCPPAELERLAEVLTRYDQHRLAESLSHRAVRQRAAEYLLNSTAHHAPQ
jgi:hypothetical protein